MAELVQIERIKKRDLNSRILELNERRHEYYIEPQLPLDRLSVKLAARRATPLEALVPDCVTCGVCCSFALIVPVTHDDTSRLSRYCDILLDDSDDEVIVDRILQHGNDRRCVHLMGKLGEKIGCEIYSDRPRVCHDFDAGSDRCHEYRRMFGIEEQLSEEDVRLAIQRLEEIDPPETIEDVSIVSSGKIERSSFNVVDGTVEYTKTEQLTIFGHLSDDKPYRLHSFEYGRENWFESDLLGLTLEEAASKIEEQAVGRVVL
jgi:Fe-S-cluster containining protein